MEWYETSGCSWAIEADFQGKRGKRRERSRNEKFVRAGRSREIKYFGRVILMVVSRIDGHGGRWCKLLFYCEGFEDTYRSAPFYTDFRNDFGGRPLLRFSISIFYENRNEWNGNFNFSEFFVSDSAIQKGNSYCYFDIIGDIR